MCAIAVMGISIILREEGLDTVLLRVGTIGAWLLLCLILYGLVFYFYESPCIDPAQRAKTTYCSEGHNIGTISAFFVVRDFFLGQ